MPSSLRRTLFFFVELNVCQYDKEPTSKIHKNLRSNLNSFAQSNATHKKAESSRPGNEVLILVLVSVDLF